MKNFISISLFIGKLLIFKYNSYSNQIEFHNKFLTHTTFIHRRSYEKVGNTYMYINYNIYLIVTTSNISINSKYYISISLLQLIKVPYL